MIIIITIVTIIKHQKNNTINISTKRTTSPQPPTVATQNGRDQKMTRTSAMNNGEPRPDFTEMTLAEGLRAMDDGPPRSGC